MQKLVKPYLWYVGLFWLLYGIANIIAPSTLSYVSGLDQSSWIVAAEVRAMYGGLEWGLGLFTLLGLCPAFNYERAAVLLNAIVLSALAVTRAAGILIDGPGLEGLAISFGMDNIPLSYNSGALWFFEVPFGILGFLLISKTKKEG